MKRLKKSTREDIESKNPDILADWGVKVHKERLEGYTYVLGYGGGLNSTALLIEIVNRKLPLDYVVFADPGFEDPETYDFINNHFAKWMMERGIKFVVVTKRKPDGGRETIVDYFMKSYRIPDQVYRDCTRRHKVEVIHRFYIRQLQTKFIIEYLGIHAGEKKRVKLSKTPWVHKCYPLVEYGIDKAGCKKIIEDAGLPVPPKSGCPNCFASNKARYYDLWKKHPDMFEKSIEIEENYLKNKKRRGLKDFYYMRFNGKNMHLRDLKKEFENMTTLESFDEDEQTTADNDCIEGCMT